MWLQRHDATQHSRTPKWAELDEPMDFSQPAFLDEQPEYVRANAEQRQEQAVIEAASAGEGRSLKAVPGDQVRQGVQNVSQADNFGVNDGAQQESSSSAGNGRSRYSPVPVAGPYES